MGSHKGTGNFNVGASSPMKGITLKDMYKTITDLSLNLLKVYNIQNATLIHRLMTREPQEIFG